MVSVKFEQEAIDNLKDDLMLLNAKKVFLITGKKSYITSGAQEIIESLKDDFEFIRFNDFEDNPNIIDVEKGVQLFKENLRKICNYYWFYHKCKCNAWLDFE